MTRPDTADIAALLRALVEGGVDFVVVGGAAAVLHGAPITTRDLDIVPSREPSNVERLVRVLGDLNAMVRDPAGRRIEPTTALFAGPGQVLLTTGLGPIDILGTLHDGRGYAELVSRTVEFHDGSIAIRAVDLPSLIEIKTTAGRAKDRLVVPILLALQEPRRKP